MDPLLGKKSIKTKYNIKCQAKKGSTMWGIPFDFRKSYSNENPLHGTDVMEFSLNESFFNSSIGAGFEFTGKSIFCLAIVIAFATALIIYGTINNTLIAILGGTVAIYFIGEIFSRGLFVFFFGYAEFEIIPSGTFVNKFLAKLTWKLQTFGVSSILSLMGAIFVANKGWELVLFWIFFSSLTAYPISAITNLVISSRHFDHNLVELSTRFGGFYPKVLALTMNYFVQLTLYSTFSQLFAMIADTYPISIAGVIMAFIFQIIMAFVSYSPWNSMKYFGIFLQVVAGFTIYLIYYAIANSITLDSLIETFSTGLCYDTAVDANLCYLGSRQLWTTVSVIFTYLCSELPSKYTQFGRFSINAFFLFFFTVIIVLASVFQGNFQIENSTKVSNDFSFNLLADILVSVPLSTVTGLLLTHGNQSSSHYIKKISNARYFGDHSIVIEAIYAIVFLMITTGVPSLENMDYKMVFTSVSNYIGTMLESSFSLPGLLTTNVFAAMILLQCLNSMESLSRGMTRSLSSYKSLEKDIRDKNEYPEITGFKVNPLTAPLKFFVITAIPIIASYTSIFEVFWNLSGIVSIIFVSYSVIMGGFYSGLLNQSYPQVIIFLLIGITFNVIGVFCSICLDIKLFNISLPESNNLYYNWIPFLFTIISYFFFMANFYLAYKAYSSFTDDTKFSRFVRSSRVERRIGFFRNRTLISLN